MRPKTEKQWQSAIKRMCKANGIDASQYTPVISTLAAIMAQRDEAYEMYVETGGHPIVKHTNKSGATNAAVNPLLDMWDRNNKTALAYWRELGLTPAAYKKVRGAPPKNAKTGELAAALAAISFDDD